jgi:putative endonuclease
MRTRRTYCVYIIGSISGTLYIGMTGNLHKRAFEHKFHRIQGFTDNYGVERLFCWESYDDLHKAIGRENQLQGWRRQKKVVLIELMNPQWLDLSKEWYPWMKECGEGRGASTAGDRSQAADLPPLSMTGVRNRDEGEHYWMTGFPLPSTK